VVGELAPVALVLLGLVGLLVGSFLNVVIVRLPDGMSIMSPPSRCSECETPIKPYDNIPVVSWFVLRGRCRACGAQFGFAYVLVEVANAVLWVAAGLRFGASWALVPMLLLFSTLLAQAVIDLELYRLLDKITFPVLAASVVLIAAVSVVEGDASRIGMAVAGGIGYAVALWVPSYVTRGKGMGLGDVKLALLLGLYLGWAHPLLILYSLILSCLIGIVVGAGFYLVRRRSEGYPFGPWLALGCILALLFPDVVLSPYDYVLPVFLAGP
jgi:leader peptidase (prepilin peptidase)/N-methyltransferase